MVTAAVVAAAVVAEVEGAAPENSVQATLVVKVTNRANRPNQTQKVVTKANRDHWSSFQRQYMKRTRTMKKLYYYKVVK